MFRIDLSLIHIYKERAVWRYKTFPLMGLDMTDEHDEVTPLSEYARLVTTSGVGRVNQSAFNAVAIDAKKLHNSTQTLAGALTKVPGVKPVSYTPLDVYKRQLLSLKAVYRIHGDEAAARA